jgi:hypothetical protein
MGIARMVEGTILVWFIIEFVLTDIISRQIFNGRDKGEKRKGCFGE